MRYTQTIVLLAALGCGGDSTTSPTPTPQRASFQLAVSHTNDLRKQLFCKITTDWGLSTCFVDITIREVSSRAGGSIDFIRGFDSAGNQSAHGASAIVNAFGTNRLEAGATFTAEARFPGRASRVVVQITDDTGFIHTLEGAL